MLDKLIEKSSRDWLDHDLKVHHPELTTDRRRFAVNYIIRKVTSCKDMIYGAGIYPGKAILGDYLKGFMFKVKRTRIQVIYAVG